MITCYLRYIIDPDRVSDFEAYGQMWIPLVEKFGGQHHGYFLFHEGAINNSQLPSVHYVNAIMFCDGDERPQRIHCRRQTGNTLRMGF
jgi:hypothetical protein